MSPVPHAFERPELLELALTHASARNGASASDMGAGGDNERLEFLGDSVLALVVAEELFREHPSCPEGELTELKAWIVSRRVLAGAARELGLETEARVGEGLRGRALPRSVLANLYEAVLGAVYLDGGIEAARRFVERTLGRPLARARDRERGPNPKQVLQNLAQVATGSPPRYVLLDDRGHAHARAFLVAAEVGERRFPSAWGRTRKEAERWAAYEALLVLEDEEAERAAGAPAGPAGERP